MKRADMVAIERQLAVGYCGPKWRPVIESLLAEVVRLRPELRGRVSMDEAESTLWAAYWDDPTEEKRNRLVELYVPRVPVLVRSLIGRGLLFESSAVGAGDYEGTAYEKLIECVELWAGGGEFWRYAAQRLRWRLVNLSVKSKPAGGYLADAWDVATSEAASGLDELDTWREFCRGFNKRKTLFFALMSMGGKVRESGRELGVSTYQAERWYRAERDARSVIKN
ncbi:hypothetical protein CA54_16760 [Symmachiella macrocystis]|uniref:Uncharacterized protein n=1 Tax=Symmachiella macrocystis TaxID=2527985 RepID=A0A5C6BL76_9PLAN|nr:hypothetical protein [Symmachiella macrocystis]TWU12850.1 hypothetical protein CA54_16760 [Symmachiella macrocystis]